MGRERLFLALLAAMAVAAGCDDTTTPPDPDGGPIEEVDAGPPEPASIDHCTFEEVPPTANAGGAVEAGALEAGVAERFIDAPLGASLAAYTARAEGFGRAGFLPEPDARRTELAGSFAPSVGIETRPRVRALALRAGGETVLILKADLASSYQGFVHDLEAALGPEFSGKVIVASSHSHSSFGNYSGHSALAVGFGRFRSTVYRAILDDFVAVSESALAALEPARIGIAYDPEFDREDRVNRDRRGENDELAGGRLDDHHLFVIRVDTAAGEPMAVLPVFGIHGTLGGADNAILHTDSTGGIERVLEESFDSSVLVMHLQGAAGDVSPAGSGAIDCGDDPVCMDFARAETVGMYALDEIRAAWDAAGEAMQSEIALEMLTRTVPLGPDWRTFTIRDGALEYAPWDGRTEADGIVYDESGALISPIDEFNAPYGAALCGAAGEGISGIRLPRSKLPGTDELRDLSYYFCNRIDQIDEVIEVTVDVDFEEPPLCDTTQTTLTALRLGDWMMGTLPGEPVTILAEHLRTLSPMPEERTIIVGYAQDHGGYLLSPEDWLLGGYEPSITFWGPLEGEYVAEQTAAVMALAATDERENGNAEGLPRVATPMIEDGFPLDTSAIEVGTVPASLPAYLMTRLLREVTQAQPAATVSRLDTVTFTFVGDDPLRGNPLVTLQREVEGMPGTFEDVVRRSGRPVQDGDLIVTWTPDPILREEGVERTHYYTVEFQAVTPMGMPGLGELGDRFGLPLGNYRFRVEGPTYELVSDPFEVVPAALSATPSASGADLDVSLGYQVPSYGYRLLDLEATSNGLVPLREGTIDVDVDGTVSTLTTAPDGTVTIAGAAGASAITITDAHGNTATFAP